MPLSKERDRERKRLARLEQVDKKGIQPENGSLQSKSRPVKRKSNTSTTLGTSSKVQPGNVPKKVVLYQRKTISGIPVYNPEIHKPGDRVIMYRGGRAVVSVVPEVDGSGQEVPEYW